VVSMEILIDFNHVVTSMLLNSPPVFSSLVGVESSDGVPRVSEELTERAWLQLVRSCALHTRCCPNFWKGGGCRMRMVRGVP